ncbi:MAG: universal stress protein [Acidobacteria bacterium]|nr:universal stress protein [Acidobacteriota bacterium]
MKVLIATDGSGAATTAIRTATRLLRREQLELELVCVAPEFAPSALKGAEPGSGKRRVRERYTRQITDEANRILGEAQQLLRSEGLEAKTLVRIGSPSEVIVGLAADYDLVVVGSHGLRERTKPGLGPVASRVLEHTPCSVLIARELLAERSLRIMLCVDGSQASEYALRTIASQFNATSAEIMLLHVIETPWIRLGLDREWFDYPGTVFDQADPEIQFDHELRREAEEVLLNARTELRHFGLSATTQIDEGNPGTQILGEAETGEYDLIVVGAAGVTDIKHEMVGSVSTTVAWHAPCAVMVAKES